MQPCTDLPSHPAAFFAGPAGHIRMELQAQDMQPCTDLPSTRQRLAAGPEDYVEACLQAQGTSLAAKLQSLSPVARVCAVKGLVSFLPVPALICPLTAEPGSLRPMHPPAAMPPGQGEFRVGTALPAEWADEAQPFLRCP